ncbi:hypothetical protein [Sphingorhabdus sp.]|uniref:hypothetical protein n=1 Tax=Sphingorhabdus sp. TaxID=1902408 RepID=UPI0032B717E2
MAQRKSFPQIAPSDSSQIMIAGIAPVSVREQLGYLANQPMQPRCKQRSLDIGFWDPMRDQLEMF